MPRGRGRPRGSRNKKKSQKLAMIPVYPRLTKGRSNYTVHSFKRTSTIYPFTISNMNQSSVYPENSQYAYIISMGFTIGSLPSSTELTNLYDQYKIVGVKVKLIPVYNSASPTDVSPGTNPKVAVIPYISTVVDYDGVSANTLSGFNQYSNLKTRLFDKPVSVYIPYPGFKDNDTTTSAAIVNRGKWIDTSKTAVNHNGLGICLTYPYDPSTAGTAMPVLIQPVVTYYLKMKNVR